MNVRPRPDLGRYELLEDLVYPGGVVLAGFTWDGASLPRATWTVTGYHPFHPQLLRGSCIHDDMYGRRIGARRDADEVFRLVIIEDHVPERDAAVMYASVRQFGCYTWMDAEDVAERDRRAQQDRERSEQAP